MSKHRASNHRSVSRLMPLGAGMTVALLAAGTGSAFAVEPAAAVPAPSQACTDATTALGTVQGQVVTATAVRDGARRDLSAARSDLAKVQRPYDDAVRSRDAAEDRLESAEKRQNEKQKAYDAARTRATTYPSRSAQRDLARATSALNDAKFDTEKARKKFAAKQAAVPAKPDTTALLQKVADARGALEKAEGALATVKGERRTARDARDAACSDVTTLR